MIESEKISAEDQWEYWLGVGILLYLVKHVQPDIANVTLLKANNHAKPTAFKELLHVVKHVFDTMNRGLKIEPTVNVNKHCEVVFLSDSYYARDPVCKKALVASFFMY